MKVNFPLDIAITETRLECKRLFHQRLHGAAMKLVLVTGSSQSREFSDFLFEGCKVLPSLLVTLGENTVSDVYRVEREMRGLLPHLIVAVGGGKVVDFAKRLAYISNISLLVVPTIIANDGLISPVAVLLDGNQSVSLPGRMPDAVLVSMESLASAPPKYLRAAACDLITNLSATNDWGRSTDSDSGRVDQLAFQMARIAAHQVLDCKEWELNSPVFLRAIIHGQMLSGVAMAIAGSSRPCSGSEHLIAHALDSLGAGMNVLHGEKVGIISRFCLHLQDVENRRVDEFFSAFEVERIFPGCADFGLDDLKKVFKRARTMRPGRETVIDSISDEVLAQRYFSYIST